MKTLSIKEPWAYLIACGKKDVENRTWKTNYRGRIYIHATRPQKGFSNIQIKLIENNMSESEYNSANDLYGEIIGEVDIIDCVTDSKSKWAELDCYHWILQNANLYETPIKNIKGQLGLWNYETSN